MPSSSPREPLWATGGSSLGISQSNASRQRARTEYLIAALLDPGDIVTPDTPASGQSKPAP